MSWRPHIRRPKVGSNRLIFDSVNSKQASDGLPDRAFERYTVKRIIRTGDREWLVTFTPRMDPLSNVAKSVSLAVLLVLLASTALMFAVLTSVATNVSQRRLLEKRHCQDELLGALSHALQNATSLAGACSVVAERVPQVTGCRGGACTLRENSSGAFPDIEPGVTLAVCLPTLRGLAQPESCLASGLAEVKCGASSAARQCRWWRTARRSDYCVCWKLMRGSTTRVLRQGGR